MQVLGLRSAYTLQLSAYLRWSKTKIFDSDIFISFFYNLPFNSRQPRLKIESVRSGYIPYMVGVGVKVVDSQGRSLITRGIHTIQSQKIHTPSLYLSYSPLYLSILYSPTWPDETTCLLPQSAIKAYSDIQTMAGIWRSFSTSLDTLACLARSIEPY